MPSETPTENKLTGLFLYWTPPIYTNATLK